MRSSRVSKNCRGEEWDGAGLENNIGVENIGDWQSRQAWRQPSLVVPTKATFQTSRYFHISCAIIIQVRVEAVLTREKIWLWFAEKDNSNCITSSVRSLKSKEMSKKFQNSMIIKILSFAGYRQETYFLLLNLNKVSQNFLYENRIFLELMFTEC